MEAKTSTIKCSHKIVGEKDSIWWYIISYKLFSFPKPMVVMKILIM